MSNGHYRHVSLFIKWRGKRQFFLCYFLTSVMLCFNAGSLYDNQLCSDIALLMKRCVSILFMNSFFADLNSRVNISLADEIFPLQGGRERLIWVIWSEIFWVWERIESWEQRINWAFLKKIIYIYIYNVGENSVHHVFWVL